MAHVLESRRRVLAEVAIPWYNSCKARKARTHAAVSRLSTRKWSSEESAQHSKGEDGGMVCVGEEEEELRAGGGGGGKR